ncbi:MAG: PEP-CTERM sorting domain-containing protein [Acidobacteria bacterium]|nr:PEP-CTERM sorting domain-containing protein [Acidobacteriota bacterium]
MNQKLKLTPLLGLIALACACAPPSEASLIVSAPVFTAAPGASGTFEVTLENTGPATIEIGGFAFEIGTSSSAIMLTGASTLTSGAYIFAGNTLFGPDIAISTGQSLIASDNPANFVAASIASGATYSLGLISYTISNNASIGPWALTFATPATSLADARGGAAAIDAFSSGQLTIGEATAVPEPGMGGLLGGAFTILWLAKRRRP